MLKIKQKTKGVTHMDILRFDTSKKGGSFKRMNAVCNGPVHKRIPTTQIKSNFATYKEARIPFARNHDASFCSAYGGEHVVDISAIFPNFDADPYAPESYDFTLTDEYVLVTLEAGTETFYRLGQKIEHGIKKYNIYPPKDFKKWAIICEHIISHYNEGWADGYRFNIQYWEIWGEPDLDPDDSPNKRMWGGTTAQFYDLFEVTAKHIKDCFPNIKIGGPGFAHRMEWADKFLGEMSKRKVPMDFCSWHQYAIEPCQIVRRAETVRALLDKHGYKDTESILDEWNYVADWKDRFIESIETIISIKGAAFIMAVMSVGQRSSIDMLMYYDARPSAFNGMWDFYTLRPLKGYSPFKWYGMFYDMKHEIVCENTPDHIYTLCGENGEGKLLSVITYYSDDNSLEDKTVKVDFGKESEYEIYLLDSEHNAELVDTTSKLEFTMKLNSCIMIKEK